ncbi:DNA (cytosine-5-)-methyltransferase [Empedobacter sp. GD03797]|uniref:DNA cytosine methyltransferase n=1 Tax=Empedobacter sp. GD03797 TaxID=2975382 RepID=UPI00244B6024|nr:DNA (cytosine-5-)-methyltransferase [Empedobacter sp. GD03797]MDH1883848.1 DNA (cytosine-5-)-methyltransferase [Empedobacter sp. GD03797]
MNVLSVFDGISCAKIALDQLGFKVENYYASEIDKHAINVSKHNHPNIIHLGDIKNIKAQDLPKIDLFIGGSPCQDLSNAQKGLGLEGSKSGLFYEYIRLLREVKPKYFLLENVKNKWAHIMSEYVGINHIEVNSTVLSAQSRPRYYWTNIDYEAFPSNPCEIELKDIIEKNVDDKYFLKKENLEDFLNSVTIKETKSKDGINKVFEIPKEIHNDNERQRRVYSLNSKSPTVLARADTTKIYINNKIRKLTPLECERLQCIPDNYTAICSDTQRYKMVGNAFTVSVIKHFLSSITKEPKNVIIPTDKELLIKKEEDLLPIQGKLF